MPIQGLWKLAAEFGRSMTTRRMYITGGIGSSGFRERFLYRLRSSRRSPTPLKPAHAIGVMMFGQRMAAITGDASYYDGVEKASYNTVIAGINIAGDRYFYVNPLEVAFRNFAQSTLTWSM